MEDTILTPALLHLDDDSLYELLVPEDERHSPDSNIPRGRHIYRQIVQRAHDAILDFYQSHQNTVSFSLDAIATLTPLIINSNATSNATAAIIVATLIIKHGLNSL